MLKERSSQGSKGRHRSPEYQKPAQEQHRDPQLHPAEHPMSDENTPLLHAARRLSDASFQKISSESADPESLHKGSRKRNQVQQMLSEGQRCMHMFLATVTNSKTWKPRTIWQKAIKEPIGLLPCVFLGVLLNVLDALSYGKSLVYFRVLSSTEGSQG